jgi:L-amino acid N-acyltransferase YncA
VAVEGGAIRGFVMTRPAQDADAIGWGEVLSVYLDPAFVGQGLGPKLLEAGRMRLASQGCRRAIGWIFEANAHIQRVVIRDGWAHDGARVMSEIGGARVPAIRFARQLP